MKVQTKADEGLGDQNGNQMVNVRREYIGTGGCESKSAALRDVVKQGVRSRCCAHTKPLHNPPMGNRQTEGQPEV